MTATPQEPQKDEAAHIDIPDTAKEAVSSLEEAKKEDEKEGEYDGQPTQKAELKNYLVRSKSPGVMLSQ
jgi:hypothetical protein